MVKKKYFKTNDECEVTFEYEAESARSVVLVSEINDWQPIEMKKRKKDGVFYARVRAPKESQFQFRYLLDDQIWVNDLAADTYVANEHGSENGVIFTKPSAN